MMRSLANSSQSLSVEVWRGTAEGAFQNFQVPRRAHQTILDVVTQIQREQDATLSYRFACRVGMCGSCAMVVNGRPRWTCRTRVSEAVDGDTLKLEPLRNFTVVKDLAVDMAAFFDKWRDAKGHFAKCTKVTTTKTTVINKTVHCRDAKGHFAKCGTPGTHAA